MKRMLSCVLSAVVAVSFAGLVFAAEHGPTDTGPADAQPPAQVQKDTSKNMKHSKKDKRKAKKAKKSQEGVTGSGSGTGGGTTPYGTGPNYGTTPQGGPSGDNMGNPNPSRDMNQSR